MTFHDAFDSVHLIKKLYHEIGTAEPVEAASLNPLLTGAIVGMFSIHCDESTDSKKRFVFTIAGYLGWHGDALDLAFKWERLLDSQGLEYFKASQCEGIRPVPEVPR